jgi:hypothetical protein
LVLYGVLKKFETFSKSHAVIGQAFHGLGTALFMDYACASIQPKMKPRHKGFDVQPGMKIVPTKVFVYDTKTVRFWYNRPLPEVSGFL